MENKKMNCYNCWHLIYVHETGKESIDICYHDIMDGSVRGMSKEYIENTIKNCSLHNYIHDEHDFGW